MIVVVVVRVEWFLNIMCMYIADGKVGKGQYSTGKISAGIIKSNVFGP